MSDGYGTAHIWIDDHCYVLGLEKRRMNGTADGEIFVTPMVHIFHEAFELLKTLPSPANDKLRHGANNPNA